MTPAQAEVWKEVPANRSNSWKLKTHNSFMILKIRILEKFSHFLRATRTDPDSAGAPQDPPTRGQPKRSHPSFYRPDSMKSENINSTISRFSKIMIKKHKINCRKIKFKNAFRHVNHEPCVILESSEKLSESVVGSIYQWIPCLVGLNIL